MEANALCLDTAATLARALHAIRAIIVKHVIISQYKNIWFQKYTNNYNIKITPVVTINAPTIQLAYQLEVLTPAHARHAILDNFVKHVK